MLWSSTGRSDWPQIQQTVRDRPVSASSTGNKGVFCIQAKVLDFAEPQSYLFCFEDLFGFFLGGGCFVVWGLGEVLFGCFVLR